MDSSSPMLLATPRIQLDRIPQVSWSQKYERHLSTACTDSCYRDPADRRRGFLLLFGRDDLRFQNPDGLEKHHRAGIEKAAL